MLVERAPRFQRLRRALAILLFSAIFIPTCAALAGIAVYGLIAVGLPDKVLALLLPGLFVFSLAVTSVFLARYAKFDAWWLTSSVLANGLLAIVVFEINPFVSDFSRDIIRPPSPPLVLPNPPPLWTDSPSVRPIPIPFPPTPVPSFPRTVPPIFENQITLNKGLGPFHGSIFTHLHTPFDANDFRWDKVVKANPPAFGAASAAYWNAWFVKDDKPVSNVLIAGTGDVYAFNLDLSAYNYATLRKDKSFGAPVDPIFAAVIADETVKTLVLTIKPIVSVDSGVSLVDPTVVAPMRVDLDKIRHPDAGAAEKYAKDPSMPISELSAKVNAGRISFPIRADAAGCANIAFSIFNGMKPLDHVVQRLVIRDADGDAPACASEASQVKNEFTGGLDSLRDAALGMETSGGPLVGDAAIHIFDSEADSMVVFVDGRKGQKRSVYGWKTDSSVVDYLRTMAFQSLVDKAQQDAANKQPGSYVTLARELWKVLFTARSSSGTQSEAKKAEAAFKELVRQSASSPVIVVRIASSLIEGQTRSLFAPLGVFGARGPDAVLDKPIVVVQPMMKERFVSNDKCIGDWTLAIPDKLQKVNDDVMDASHFPTPYPGNRIRDIASFKPYLSNTSPAPASPAAGLLVLAHQDQGFLWFDADTDHIIKQDIARNFPIGSVGIFSACSAAAPNSRSVELLQKLNEQGIDTLIASPFTIKAEYGIRFAYAFVEAVEESMANRERPTILDLFNRAIAKTAQKFTQMNNGDYEELGLEYVLLGNPAITLCAAPSPAPHQ